MIQSVSRRSALAVAAAGAFAATARAQSGSPVGVPPRGFVSREVAVQGSNIHYVRGGEGPPLVLLHGFPLDWAEYRRIMPQLASKFTIVAIDLPGLGRSAPPTGGYDTANLAGYVRGVIDALALDLPYVVGHDFGGLVAYSYLRRFPAALRGAMILDVPLPGVAGWEEANAGLWHVGFMQTPGLAEQLVRGRQAVFLGWFYGLGRFAPEERAYFIEAYDMPQLRAGFEVYRALPRSAEWNAAQTGSNSVPLLLVSGEKSFMSAMLPTVVGGLRAKGMTDVGTAQIAGAGHYVVADSPSAVAALIERYGR